MKIIRLLNFSGVTLNLDHDSWTSVQSSNVVNPGKIFHSNSIGSPSILSKALYSGEFLNHFNLSSHAMLTLGSRTPFQDIIQNPEYVDICVQETDDFHHQSKRNPTMKNLPSKLFSIHRSLLIVRLSVPQMCRTSVSL